ncbi:MCE family protein [Mycobacterium heckeshornense]|uniref:Mammalian cell entry protein n=1 Tax=Mycobacterium heckeshornense TaxID=110505 RepID=A0A2I3EJQ6_9MYCO|nr:MlaD family protein [Mycobacterium heckeshornense]KMV17512.1 mammalian cell entry protein [Mycobacterium heckeshornense]MCV7035920.1 MCE family protein [Mycobacterium heckeshornense]BCO36327.1 mammalian cell entry protein [Mycobacterium heckeshornense]
MRMTRATRIQLAVFAVIVLGGLWAVFGYYYQLPRRFFGVGTYTVRVQLARADGLYEGGDVTYRGVDVGRISDVRLTNTGAEAVLQLNSGTHIPDDLSIQVHSFSAVGEQYLALLPRNGNSPPLKNGDVIPADRTTFPPNINSLLAAANRGLNAIPRDNLKTVVDESYIAFGGLGPELSRLVNGATTLAKDARKNLDPLVTVIDESKPILDSQTESSDSIRAWAAHLATVTKQLQTNDTAVQGILRKAPQAADEVRALLDRLQPTLPIVLANLVSVGEVAVTYRDNLEALLVLLPQGAAAIQAIQVPNKNTKQDYKGAFLDFNLNLNLPPPCTTGFFPIQQQRAASFEDYPDRPKGNVYCRIPQDSNLTAVRGARNYPCETRPGKRAATVKMCESSQDYIPLNDGFNWKGDPNATFTGQGVPQFDPGESPPAQSPPALASPGSPPPSSGPAPLPIAAAQYDPATGTYVGPDGQLYTQSNLAHGADKEKTWQQMLTPPTGS